MTVSNSKAECHVLHSSPFTSPGVSSCKALLLALPGSAPQLCVSLRPLAACGIAHLRVRTWGHFQAGGFALCRVPGSPQPPCPTAVVWLGAGCECQTCAQPGCDRQNCAQPCHVWCPWGGQCQLPLSHSSCVGVTVNVQLQPPQTTRAAAVSLLSLRHPRATKTALPPDTKCLLCGEMLQGRSCIFSGA